MAAQALPSAEDATHFARLLELCDDVVFSVGEVSGVEENRAYTALYTSGGVSQLLGYTPDEFNALGCGPRVAHTAVCITRAR